MTALPSLLKPLWAGGPALLILLKEAQHLPLFSWIELLSGSIHSTLGMPLEHPQCLFSIHNGLRTTTMWPIPSFQGLGLSHAVEGP